MSTFLLQVQNMIVFSETIQTVVGAWIGNDRISSARLSWLEAILWERFGLDFSLSFNNGSLFLRLYGHETHISFDCLVEAFSRNASDIPCTSWDAAAEGCYSVLGSPLPAPAVTQLPFPLIEQHEAGHVIHYDILGLTYWMLSRSEEVDRMDLDKHGRFPAISSHAFRYGYLDRPIVDEWLHILGQVIERQWPGIGVKRHQFCMKVSHDVDYPSCSAFLSLKQLARLLTGDILRRRNLRTAGIAAEVWLLRSKKLHPADSMNTFDWIMDVSEKRGLRSAFYFICGRTVPAKDAQYEIEHPAMRHLLRSINERGHEIGLHPSYGSFQSSEIIVAEAERLRRVCADVGIMQDEWGGRMHYLRWEHPTTMFGLDRAGMTYDTTLSYADQSGFRCGTCFEYPSFDPVAGRVLHLRIRPLIAMECTVIAERYMGFGIGEEAYQKFSGLKHVCKAVGGCFTLLWHNSSFPSLAERKLYQRVLDA